VASTLNLRANWFTRALLDLPWRVPHCPSLIVLVLLFASFVQAQLSDAISVRSLTAEQAEEARTVRLRATVGFIESPGTIFVQDETAGTFLRTKQPIGELREGDEVEAQGRTFPGLFLPGIEVESLRVVGHGNRPRAQPANYDDLALARFHYQRVQVTGIVRSVTSLEENRSVLRLAMGSRVLEVRIDGAVAGDDWVDARVRIEGLAAGTINDLRQLVQPYLRVSSSADIVVEEPARSVNEVALTTTSGVLGFSATGETGRRVRVRGTVTGVFARSVIFIRDDDASVAVQLIEVPSVRLGDVVMVAGFPIMDRYTPTLADANLLEINNGELAEPVPLGLKDMPRKARDGDLISVQGTVVERYRSDDGQTIIISDGGMRLPARLESGEEIKVELQSEVALTGICRVESVSGVGFNAKPQTFRLWLRGGSDIHLTRAPPFWTVARLLSAMAVLACVLMAGVVWIMLLRRQVSALRLRIRHEAALEERQRIAREFHDTLEQELAGLSLRMDAAVTRPMEDKARVLLETSRSLVSRIQAEARNLVADLRDDPVTQVELVNALRDLAERQPANAPVIRLEVSGTLPALPSPAVHHLRMIAQEAVTNALKHAHATSIVLRLRHEGRQLELSVIDDGAGFAPDGNTEGKPGHFGCMGIRERCRKIGARVDWLSSPGQGTTLVVRLSFTD